ncbi:MAG: Coenzyme F420 hydrogenase/dehydrogenase, beta subunit C-terminal domain [Dehalococcoidia bacterium]|nr:Coenzyme F420 hydrogenase/dehydrogenase, beta subunit C-terminal domain [Dehalococcoidia bacterium]
MATDAIIEVSEGKLIEGINNLFGELLKKGLVDALLIPHELPSGANVVQTLITSPEKIKSINPLAPVLPINSARIVSAMTKVASSAKKIGVVLRPCELRALIELVKLKQASLENLVLIGMDCFGTYSVCDYGKFAKEGPSPTQRFLDNAKSGKDDPLLREACQICEYSVPINADLTIGLIGMDLNKGFLLHAATKEGERILEGLGVKAGSIQGRQEAIDKLVAQRIKRRDEVFARTIEQTHGLDKLLPVFAPCINCHNCRDACPICYCKECFFDSPTFELEADKYLGRASKRGALRMPTDTLFFHLTRLNHMGVSCVGCGLCQEACPNDVPVFDIFRLVGSRLQKVFDYVPGRSLEEELPLTTFKANELEEVGH